MPLRLGKSPQKRPLQVGIDEFIELDLILAGCEGNGQWHPSGKANVLIRVLAQGSLCDLRNPSCQVIVTHPIRVVDVALFERLQRVEIVGSEHAHQAVEFLKPVLQRGGGELVRSSKNVAGVPHHIPPDPTCA